MNNLDKKLWLLYGLCTTAFIVLMPTMIILLGSGRVEGYGRPLMAFLPAIPWIIFLVVVSRQARQSSEEAEQA